VRFIRPEVAIVLGDWPSYADTHVDRGKRLTPMASDTAPPTVVPPNASILCGDPEYVPSGWIDHSTDPETLSGAGSAPRS